MKTLRLLLLFATCLAISASWQAQDVLTLDDIKTLIELKTDEADILRLVKRAESLRFADADFAKLKSLGAGDALVREIREAAEADVVGRILGMMAAGESDDAILKSIGEGRKRTLGAEERLRLKRGKAKDDMIHAIEGRYVFPGFKIYRDPLGILSMQHPKDWFAYTWYTAGGVKILLSPEAGVPEANNFKIGVQIQISFIENGSFGAGESDSLLESVRRRLPGFLRLNRPFQMAPVEDAKGVPREIRMSGLTAVEQDLYATMMGTPCRETMIQLNFEDLHYFIECVAPKDAFSGYDKTFRQMKLTLIPSPDRVQTNRRRERLEPNEALDLYREAVVLVQSDFGAGSGFFARKDGYVLTNHHVICGSPNHRGCEDPANWIVDKEVELVWDARVPSAELGRIRRTVKADFVDTVYGLSPRLDFALLKVRGGGTEFRTIPMSPIGSGFVHEGDPAVAVGFPRGDLFGEGNLILTSGAISRFHYVDHPLRMGQGRRELDCLYTDAEIHMGNSGGALRRPGHRRGDRPQHVRRSRSPRGAGPGIEFRRRRRDRSRAGSLPSTEVVSARQGFESPGSHGARRDAPGPPEHPGRRVGT